MSYWNPVKAGAKKAATFAALTLLVLGLGQSSSAATLNVPGSYSTIQAAVNAAKAGDTVLVASGTYNERVNVKVSGTTSAPIIIKAATARSAKMQGFDVNGTYITMDGFEITNSVSSIGLTACGVVVYKDGAVVNNCYLHDLYDHGIEMYWVQPWPKNCVLSNNYICNVQSGINANGDNLQVLNNEIYNLIQHDSSYDADYCRLFGNGVEMRGNYFHGTTQANRGTAHTDCIQWYDDNHEYLQNAIIEQNTLMDCDEGIMANADNYFQMHDITFRNNVVANCWAWALDLHNQYNFNCYNNTFANMSTNGVGFRAGTYGAIQNNIFYNAGSIYFADAGATITAGGYNLDYTSGTKLSGYSGDIMNSDPKFANVSGNDYHLQSTSPAIDKGCNDGLTNDRDGNARPQGAGYDIGAYEYGSGSTPPPPPTISINDISVTEGNSGTTNATFTISLSAATTQDVTVYAATADGTATVADNDYQPVSGTLTIPAGSTSVQGTALVNGDTKVESDETFYVNLSNPTNATIAKAQGVCTIKNDDVATLPALSVSDISANEGNSGTTPFTFTVTMSQASAQTVTVNYATADGTATVADNDYQAASGTLSFAAGTTSKTVTVNVVGDTKMETNETFTLNLSSPTNATLSRTGATATILDDDTGGPSGLVGFWTMDDGSGTTAKDYSTTGNNGTVSGGAWCAGECNGAVDLTATTSYIQVGTTNMSTAAGSVAMWAKPSTLSSVGGFLFGQCDASWGNRIQLYYNDASGGLCVGLGNNHAVASNVTVLPVNIWTHVAMTWDGTNYVVYVNGAAVASGTYSGLSTLNTLADIGNNGFPSDRSEGFMGDLDDVRVYNRALSASEVSSISGTMATPPAISIANVSQAEGNSGTTNFNFNVTLNAASTLPVSVNYTTVDGTAKAGTDYVATSGTITFPAGSTSQTISVGVLGNTTYQPNRTFGVTLSNPVNATIANANSVGTIVDDDPAPVLPALSITDLSFPEGDSGTKVQYFIVSLSSPSSSAVTVNYTTADGTATVADGDYLKRSGTITLAAGSTWTTLGITVNGDTKIESNETFTVNLSNPVNATIAKATGTATILNDDGLSASALSINDGNIVPGPAKNKTMTFTVVLNKKSSSKITVHYATQDGTAKAGTDYTAKSGTLTFSAGTTSQSIPITILPDAATIPQKAFSVVLSSPTNGLILKSTGNGYLE